MKQQYLYLPGYHRGIRLFGLIVVVPLDTRYIRVSGKVTFGEHHSWNNEIPTIILSRTSFLCTYLNLITKVLWHSELHMNGLYQSNTARGDKSE
jgi:hypothetical protein